MSQSYRTELKRVFEDPETYASTMIVALVDRLGVEFFTWDPNTIKLELSALYQAEAPAENLDKLNAMLLAITTNQFYVSLESFTNICNALVGYGVDFRVYDPAELDEMAWGVTEVGLMAPPEQDDLAEAFSEEIRYYVGQRAQEEGLARLPRPLDSFGILTDAGYNAEDKADIDSEMYAAYHTSQQGEITEIQSWVKERLSELFRQIEQLPLVHGDSEAWQEFSGRGLRVPHRSRPQEMAGFRLPPMPALRGRSSGPIVQP